MVAFNFGAFEYSSIVSNVGFFENQPAVESNNAPKS